jgi:hypothetical protein
VWTWLTSRRWWRWQTAAGFSGLLLTSAVFLNAVTAAFDESNEHANDRTLRQELARVRFEQECRFELSTPVSAAQAIKLDALALGLVALERGDEPSLLAQIERIEQASADEQVALDARAAAVDTCNARAREAGL